jgi:hypothetical protein
MTLSCVWWLIQKLYVRHHRCICVTRLINMCETTQLSVWDGQFICGTWLIYICDATHSCVSWFIHLYDMTYLYIELDFFEIVACLVDIGDMPHSYVQHASFICATWLIHVWDTTHWDGWKNSIIKSPIFYQKSPAFNQKSSVLHQTRKNKTTAPYIQ